MKLTKEVVEVLKYHGYMTFTENTETFLKYFNTVEDLGDSGFITDRGAIDFLKSLFDEDGVNRSAEVGEEEIEKQAEVIKETISEHEKVEEKVETPTPEPESEKVEVKPKPKKTTTKKKTTEKES